MTVFVKNGNDYSKNLFPYVEKYVFGYPRSFSMARQHAARYLVVVSENAVMVGEGTAQRVFPMMSCHLLIPNGQSLEHAFTVTDGTVTDLADFTDALVLFSIVPLGVTGSFVVLVHAPIAYAVAR